MKQLFCILLCFLPMFLFRGCGDADRHDGFDEVYWRLEGRSCEGHLPSGGLEGDVSLSVYGYGYDVSLSTGQGDYVYSYDKDGQWVGVMHGDGGAVDDADSDVLACPLASDGILSYDKASGEVVLHLDGLDVVFQVQ